VLRAPQTVPLTRRIKRLITRGLVAAQLPVIRLLPLPALRVTASTIGLMVTRLSFRRQAMMEHNLIAVFGDQMNDHRRSAVRRRSVVNVAKTMAEFLKLPWISDGQLSEIVSLEGREHMDAALARGKGVLLITAHFGNWELAGALLSVLGYPMNVVARDATDPLIGALFGRARSSKGIKAFGRWDGRAVLRALRGNECVAILPDQHAAEGAVRNTFLGRTADTAVGPATFALRTGAQIVPAFTYRQPDDRILFRIFPPVTITTTGERRADTLAITQLINDIIGEQIMQHPEQWLWLHDRWKAERGNGSHA